MQVLLGSTYCKSDIVYHTCIHATQDVALGHTNSLWFDALWQNVCKRLTRSHHSLRHKIFAVESILVCHESTLMTLLLLRLSLGYNTVGVQHACGFVCSSRYHVRAHKALRGFLLRMITNGYALQIVLSICVQQECSICSTWM